MRDRLQERFLEAERELAEERLPRWDVYLEKDTKVAGFIAEQEEKICRAIEDEDKVLFEKFVRVWRKAWWRVNEILAEAYRKATPDPENWELRYIKWMNLVYIRFDSPLGEFYLVPRRPQRRPRVKHWYTVDEMLAMLNPGIAAAINTFGALPERPESLPGPEPGFKHMQLDFSSGKMQIRFEIPKGAS